MKIDIDKKHPFSSVILIAENEEEKNLSEEEKKPFFKVGVQTVRLTVLCLLCLIPIIPLEILVDFSDGVGLGEAVVLAAGAVGLTALAFLFVLLIRQNRKLKVLSEKVKKRGDE